MSEPIIIPPIKLTIRKPTKEFYITFVSLIAAASGNSISNLEKELIEECYLNNNGVFDTDCRKNIRSRLGISVDNLNNYIGKLKKKGLIDENAKLVPTLIIPSLKVPDNLQNAQVQIIFTMAVPK